MVLIFLPTIKPVFPDAHGHCEAFRLTQCPAGYTKLPLMLLSNLIHGQRSEIQTQENLMMFEKSHSCGTCVTTHNNHESWSEISRSLSATSVPNSVLSPFYQFTLQKVKCLHEGYLCKGGTLSMVFRLPRVDTTLKLSVQSQETWR